MVGQKCVAVGERANSRLEAFLGVPSGAPFERGSTSQGVRIGNARSMRARRYKLQISSTRNDAFLKTHMVHPKKRIIFTAKEKSSFAKS
jgi:hypothetical protein